MKVDVAEVNDVERRLTVAVPSESVDSEIEKAYLDLKKNVKLKGFRPGKAPVSILQRYFKSQVEEDVIGKLVKQTYPQALEEVKVQPVSQPKIENGVLEKGKDFSYTAVFEIRPEIDVQGYEGLELEKQRVEVTEEDLSREIETLRNSYATMEDVENRAAARGDYAIIDFEGTIDGRPYGGGKRTDFFLELTGDAFLPGFTARLEGLQKGGEKRFPLAVPESHEDKEIAGKTIDFWVQLKNIKTKTLPELNDDFAGEVGDYADFEDLKNKLRERLVETRQGQSEAGLREKIFDALIEKNPFEVPKSMVEIQARNMIEDMQRMFEARGVRLEDMGRSPAQLMEQYRAPAERQVRSALLLHAVAEKEGLKVSEEDLEKKYEEFAKQVHQDVAFVKSKVDSEMLKPQVVERKAIELIISKATVKDVEPARPGA